MRLQHRDYPILWYQEPARMSSRALSSVERLAVQLQARRRVGLSILHPCPCGGIASCNGFMGWAASVVAGLGVFEVAGGLNNVARDGNEFSGIGVKLYVHLGIDIVGAATLHRNGSGHQEE